jgi:hypothetical protein
MVGFSRPQEKYDSQEEEPNVTMDFDIHRDSQGMNVKIRGLRDAIFGEKEEEPNKTRTVTLINVASHPFFSCANNGMNAAIVVGEAYQRPAKRRSLEISIASTVRRIFGNYPDWSFGPAQIRLSTAFETLTKFKQKYDHIISTDNEIDLHPDAIMKELQDGCASTQIAGLIINDIELNNTDFSPVQVAAAYRGNLNFKGTGLSFGHERMVELLMARYSSSHFDHMSYDTGGPTRNLVEAENIQICFSATGELFSNGDHARIYGTRVHAKFPSGWERIPTPNSFREGFQGFQSPKITFSKPFVFGPDDSSFEFDQLVPITRLAMISYVDARLGGLEIIKNQTTPNRAIESERPDCRGIQVNLMK